jgi:hypothetical protein
MEGRPLRSLGPLRLNQVTEMQRWSIAGRVLAATDLAR